jgi:hypothetical protein
VFRHALNEDGSEIIARQYFSVRLVLLRSRFRIRMKMHALAAVSSDMPNYMSLSKVTIADEGRLSSFISPPAHLLTRSSNTLPLTITMPCLLHDASQQFAQFDVPDKNGTGCDVFGF